MKMHGTCYFYSFVFSKSGILHIREHSDRDAFLEYVERLNTSHSLTLGDLEDASLVSSSLSSQHVSDTLDSYFSQCENADSSDVGYQLCGVISYNRYVSCGMLVVDVPFEEMHDFFQESQSRILRFCDACSAEMGAQFYTMSDEVLFDLLEETYTDMLGVGVTRDPLDCNPFVFTLCLMWILGFRYVLRSRVFLARRSLGMFAEEN